MKNLVPAILAVVSLAAVGCNRNRLAATTGGPIDPGMIALRVDVSPNPSAKGQTVTVDASASWGAFTSFEFDFGDGSPVVIQPSPAVTHVYDVLNHADTHYPVKVRGIIGDGDRNFLGDLLVKDLPPTVTQVDSGADQRAVIGEWIHVIGENFTASPLPVIVVDGQPATAINLIDDQHLDFRTPPRARAGVRALSITWDAYPAYTNTLDVRRFATETSARYDKVWFLDVAPNETLTNPGFSIPVTDASVVKLSPDGSTAYVDDGRFNFLTHGTITIIDLTADGHPAVHGTMAAGTGPLFDIETAANAPVLAAGDQLGITLFDIRDPLNPVQGGYASALFAGDPANDVAACDLAVSPDGHRVVALNALSAQARIFDINPTTYQFVNPLTPVRRDVGPKTQNAAISSDGRTLYVLGGGGPGAVPMDLSDPRAANLSAIDLTSDTMVAGPYLLSNLNGTNPVAPVPFDLAVSRNDPSAVYVTTLDQGFTTLFNLLDTLVNDFTLQHLLDVISFLAGDGLNFGRTWPISGANTNGAALGVPMQESWAAPTAADLLYNDHKLVQSSFRLSYDSNSGNFHFDTGSTEIDLATHTSIYTSLATEDLTFDAVFGLFQPPFSFGDVVLQP